jgi:hypothetical protein
MKQTSNSIIMLNMAITTRYERCPVFQKHLLVKMYRGATIATMHEYKYNHYRYIVASRYNNTIVTKICLTLHVQSTMQAIDRFMYKYLSP